MSAAPQKSKLRQALEVTFPDVFLVLDEPHRYKVCYGGRAGGRSWTIARKLLLRGTEKPLLILCTRELQKSIKQSVHRLLSNQIKLMGMEKFYAIQNDKIIGANGTEFIFLGIRHNVDEIKSTEGVDIVWIEEAHNLTETGWDIIEPTIRAQDSEIWLSFNTRFKFDFAYQHFIAKEPPPDTVVVFSNYWDNPFFPDVLRQSMEHMKATNYEKYLNIWCGELKQLAEGAIFGKSVTKVEKEGRRCPIPIEDVETFTFMDVGLNDETSIWFLQRVGMQNRMIDYFEGRLEDVKYYAKFITRQDHSYGMHYMPHDAEHRRLGIDTRSLEEQFQSLGVRPTTIVERIQEKVTAHNLARDIMNRTWFHRGDDGGRPPEQCEGYYQYTENEAMMTRARRCERGWEALCNYRYKYKDEDDVFHQTPHHDWASNGADGFMQYAQAEDFKTPGAGKYDDWDEPING